MTPMTREEKQNPVALAYMCRRDHAKTLVCLYIAVTFSSFQYGLRQVQHCFLAAISVSVCVEAHKRYICIFERSSRL